MAPFNSNVSNALRAHAQRLNQTSIASLFKQDSKRFESLHLQSDQLLIDFSKQRITIEAIELLCLLAKERGLSQSIEALFTGAIVNKSEKRPALHTALRSPSSEAIWVNDENIVEQVHRNLARMESLIEQIHMGQWLGCSGQPIEHIVNIGVGGSDLGPLMACHALDEFSITSSRKIGLHFVSSMDGSHLSSLLDKLDPALTLFVISSKSFKTVDTLANANTALEWLKRADINTNVDTKIIIKQHFIGISANPSRMLEWGIPTQNQLYFWEWTGGRFSLWSTIGFSVAIRIGMDRFREMLAGANAMDCHFRKTHFTKNIPVLMALVSIWNINFLNITAHAILPYDGRLSHLPSYLEQLEMESNGKSTNQHGIPVKYNTCPILWGEVGSNAQHAFYQLLHQGTVPVMCDFIACTKRYENTSKQELKHQHFLNLSNCLAQSQLLALGDSIKKDSESLPDFKRYKGNQPCTTILLETLTPHNFGMLIALYEHKVFVQSVIWDINPFDQWGVELGKKMATDLLPFLKSSSSDRNLDSSTAGLINHIKN